MRADSKLGPAPVLAIPIQRYKVLAVRPAFITTLVRNPHAARTAERRLPGRSADVSSRHRHGHHAKGHAGAAACHSMVTVCPLLLALLHLPRSSALQKSSRATLTKFQKAVLTGSSAPGDGRSRGGPMLCPKTCPLADTHTHPWTYVKPAQTLVHIYAHTHAHARTRTHARTHAHTPAG